MATLTLVRHGQASFGAANYDTLSDLGQRQSERLGAYFQSQGIEFSAVWTGTLHRHAQTLAGIERGMNAQALNATARPELDEYDSQALLAAWQALQGSQFPGLQLPRPGDVAAALEFRKSYFRQLKLALTAWVDGQIDPIGMPSYADFAKGVASVLADIAQNCTGAVLLVSSGGPISQAVAHTLQAPPASVVALNLQLRNSAVSETIFSPRGHQLLSFNTLPHLVGCPAADWVSAA